MTARLRIPHLPGQFDPPMVLGNHCIERSSEARVVVIDRKIVIRLTPMEYCLFSYLLEKPHMLVSVDEMATRVLQTTSDQSDPRLFQNMDRHISALRCKLRYSGLSVRRVIGCGWLLTEYQDA
ncbi:MAG TPA: winged helix-turn-helix domain-containing protein [Ktedonobacteraceae bacterium]|nr:winged helix-turn-helix domain-containing protein [Ktedonobacteraceae bacterium]